MFDKYSTRTVASAITTATTTAMTGTTIDATNASESTVAYIDCQGSVSQGGPVVMPEVLVLQVFSWPSAVTGGSLVLNVYEKNANTVSNSDTKILAYTVTGVGRYTVPIARTKRYIKPEIVTNGTSITGDWGKPNVSYTIADTRG